MTECSYATMRPEDLQDAYRRLLRMARSASFGAGVMLAEQITKIRAAAKSRGIELEEQK